MKSTFKILTLFFALLCGIENASSQVPCGGPYDIVNNQSCDIIIDVQYMCNNTVCQSWTGIVVVPGQVFSLPINAVCSACSGNCDVVVQLVQAGVTVFSPAITVSGAMPTQSFPPTPGCSSVGNMIWSPNKTDVN